MSYFAQLMVAKMPVLAGSGILGVSLAGACAGLIGVSFTIEAEIVSAVAGMVAAGLMVAKNPPR